MFDWFGKKKREEEWMKQPRRLPDGTDQPPSQKENDRWVLSREFASGEKKNERMYMAAERHTYADGTEYWSMSVYSYNLEHDKSYGISSWPMGHTNDPMEVVRDLRTFEQERRAANFEAIESAPPTYRAFANGYGVHFDDQGNIFNVQKEQPLAKDTYMSRKSLDALFQKEQRKPIDSWEELYAQLVDSWPAEWTEKLTPEELKLLEPAPEETIAEEAAEPAAKELEADEAGEKTAVPAAAEENAEEAKTDNLKKAFNEAAAAAPEKPATPAATADAQPQETAAPAKDETPAEPPKPTTRPVTLEDLSKDPSYPEFAYYARLMVEEIKKLPQIIYGNQYTQIPQKSVKGMDSRHSIKFDSEGKAKLAQRLSDATLLVGLMRAGAGAYGDIFSGKQPMSPQMLALVGEVGEACAALAEKRLGLTAEQAKKVADLLSHGEDPFGPALPIEKLFEKFPPADFKPEPARQEQAKKIRAR